MRTIHYTFSGFLVDLLGGSSAIAAFCHHYEFALAGLLGLFALTVRDREHSHRPPAAPQE